MKYIKNPVHSFYYIEQQIKKWKITYLLTEESKTVLDVAKTSKNAHKVSREILKS